MGFGASLAAASSAPSDAVPASAPPAASASAFAFLSSATSARSRSSSSSVSLFLAITSSDSCNSTWAAPVGPPTVPRHDAPIAATSELTTLPVDAVLPGLVAGLRRKLNAVVVAPPGSGKTTRVPPALLDVVDGTVVVLQPRRVAARMAAQRIAQERGGRVGGEVGYRTRFERKVSSETRIEFVTEGLLLRRLQADPFLEGVGAVVLDELHERSLDIDLALALLREVQQEARDDLRLVVMSATLDPGPVQSFLGGEQGCDVVLAEGRAFPVELDWLPRESTRRIEEQVASAVRRVLAEEARGHVLVFLPSVRTIAAARRGLLDGDLPGDVRVFALHGSLPPKEQDAALAPWEGGRKVVLATNVAETSVTFDGVRTVIDAGLAVVDQHVLLEALELAVVQALAAAVPSFGARAKHLEERRWIVGGVLVHAVADGVPADDGEVGVGGQARLGDANLCIRIVGLAGTVSEGHAHIDSEVGLQPGVPQRSPRHRHHLPIQVLVANSGLLLQAQVLGIGKALLRW